MPRSPIVAVYGPSAKCGKEAQRVAYLVAEHAEERLGVKVFRVERQLAHDLHPDISEAAAEAFCIDRLRQLIMEESGTVRNGTESAEKQEQERI